VVVADVEKFAGHITCDSRSKSEIVVPVRNRKGDLLAVFDVDSERLNTFDKEDQQGLEKLMSWFAATP
jgi:L-methionine (R)-S-oxide reductase